MREVLVAIFALLVIIHVDATDDLDKSQVENHSKILNIYWCKYQIFPIKKFSKKFPPFTHE